MTVKELLNEKGRVACVDVRHSKGNYLLFSSTPEEFSKNGYVADSCNTISVLEIMNLNVSDYFVPDGCNSLVIQTQ